MKKILLPLFAAGVFAMPSLAQASSNPYISASGGLGLQNHSNVNNIDDAIVYKAGFVTSGALGLRDNNVRLEAEVGYHSTIVDNALINIGDAKLAIWTYMANGYYDIAMNNPSVTPYIMAGLGMSDATLSDGNVGSQSSNQFTWQVGGGFGIKASDKVTIDIGYRYLSPSDGHFDGATVSLSSHNIMGGLRYAF
ncbi:MAG: porin family protein [Chlorobiaceae bacterium]|nr:porin family protein [Chlorobiaceae bacterium]